MSDKLYALLGFAAKSGSLCYGLKDSVWALSHSKAKGVFFAADISAKSRKEILFKCDKFGVGAYELGSTNMEKLSACVGRKCGVIAITNSSFADPVISHLTSVI